MCPCGSRHGYECTLTLASQASRIFPVFFPCAEETGGGGRVFQTSRYTHTSVWNATRMGILRLPRERCVNCLPQTCAIICVTRKRLSLDFRLECFFRCPIWCVVIVLILVALMYYDHSYRHTCGCAKFRLGTPLMTDHSQIAHCTLTMASTHMYTICVFFYINQILPNTQITCTTHNVR